ncbi:hypothetical protein [Yinghuangia sp. YIM S09857]|uniref:hypothetical protein n=1 Tax=Yinghuangia sp. YIM S09857 TaxID=3436929 RepID=UPI003F536F61
MNTPPADELLARARRAAARHTGAAEADAASLRIGLDAVVSAFTALDAALATGASLPNAWAAATSAPGWRAELRNTAGHTVAVAHLDPRLTPEDAACRITSDMGIYCSWLIRDAVLTSTDEDHRAPVVVPNPDHERTRAELDARRPHPTAP